MMLALEKSLTLRNEALTKLKLKAHCTNMMGHFQITWKCWFKWVMLCYFHRPFHWPVYVHWLIICWK